MKWLIKAATQKMVSLFPYSESANYVFQRYVTKTLPVGPQQFQDKVLQAAAHLSFALKYLPHRRLSQYSIYEFGAGWDLTIPLTYYALGIDQQTLVDIRPNLRLELINEGLRKLSENRRELEELVQRPLRDPGNERIHSIEDLKLRFGIKYLAPCDAADTKLPSSSFDLITSTYTLEHIPKNTIMRVLHECQRLLNERGVMSSLIDMRDHYAYFDPALSDYNYLKFSNASWHWINSPLHYQNRLRLSDYLELIEDSGMRIVFQELDQPTGPELTYLRTMRLSLDFRTRYSLEDLAVKRVNVVSLKNSKVVS
jgi:hypothetical protein